MNAPNADIEADVAAVAPIYGESGTFGGTGRQQRAREGSRAASSPEGQATRRPWTSAPIRRERASPAVYTNKVTEIYPCMSQCKCVRYYARRS